MKIFVIGAGAAGLAFSSFLKGFDISVLERNEFSGRKLLATGNGRCNFSNFNMSEDKFVSEQKDFVKDSLKNFDDKNLRDYFEKIGIEWLSLESGRCYPKTMSSKTVRDSLFLEASENAKFIFNTFVKDIDFDKKIIISDKKKYKYDILVIASGGKTSKNTGSDASLEKILSRKTKIIPTTVGITNFESPDKLSKRAKGTKVKAKASLFIDNRFEISSIEDIIFQDYGLTGTAILDLSNHASLGIKMGKNIRVDIDFYPEMSFEDLKDKLVKKHKRYPNRSLEQLLLGFLHEKLIIDLIKRARIDNKEKNMLSNIEKIAKTLKKLSFSLTDIHDKENAQVTIGGVSCQRIDKKTMRSLDIEDVYFIGEVMDVAGSCGGYNLQWAFSSAKSASDHIRRLNV